MCSLHYVKISREMETQQIPERMNLKLIRNRRGMGYIYDVVTEGATPSSPEPKVTEHMSDIELYALPLKGIPFHGPCARAAIL